MDLHKLKHLIFCLQPLPGINHSNFRFLRISITSSNMAFGRMRNNKRSSSSNSHLSSVTTVVFIALCVLGVWMLTSNNNVVSPQPTKPDESTTFNKPVLKASASFDDNPGNLPDDALKTGYSQKNLDYEKKDFSKESTVGGSYQHNVENKDSMHEIEPNIDDHFVQKESDEEQKNQTERQTQVSEESTLTEKQNIQQSIADEHDSDRNKQQDQTEESRDGHQSGKRIEEATQKFDKQQQALEEQQQQQKANDQQRAEDQGSESVSEQPKDVSQQRTGDYQQQHQQHVKKSISFSDETKKDPTKQETSEDSIAKQERYDTSQQDKLMARQQEDEAAKQGESNESKLPNLGIPKESNESKKSWSTQAAHSDNEKQRQKDDVKGKDEESLYGYTWQFCNSSEGADYIPCLDNEQAVKKLRSRKHFQHRERHCPEDPPTCLVPTPQGYKRPVQWPESRDKIWFHNVPHPELAKVKGHQNWVKVSGEFLTFPGGGTQFIHGALHYIDFLEKTVQGIKWGKHSRVVLDVGCGVASFGGYLFDRDVLTMSFAPKDEHEAQVQLALERGIPAISAVMGSQRLPFPSIVFDVVHCARCRVPWHEEGGRLLLELNRVLRPGGHFIWSATPVYQKLKEDVEIWEAMLELTASMCWRLEKKEKDALNNIGAAIFRKPSNNQCYDQRKENIPPMCISDDDPDAAWYVPLQACMHRIPTDPLARGSKWPIRWAKRLETPPYWLNKTQMGIYGKPAPDDFEKDYEHWQYVVNNTYLNGLGISWSNVRNAMDMRAAYGGFAAAIRDLRIWVLNVVNVNAPDTLPIIYERGLFGIYHDWCESFSTYPRTYDLLHADHLFSKLKERCELVPVLAEVDRIVRPGGKLIVRDESGSIEEVENLLKSLRWEVHLTFSKDKEGILSATKSDWRPTSESS